MFTNLREVIIDKKGKCDRGIRFIVSEEQEDYISYGDVYEKAVEMYALLKARGVKLHNQVIMQVSNDYDFIRVFWACIIGKILPVPLTTRNSEEDNFKIINIINALKNPVIVADSKRIEEIKAFLGSNVVTKDVLLININETIDMKLSDIRDEIDNEGCEPEELAFIQFSSGSTGVPKGVKITHKNIMSNIESMIKSSAIVDDDTLLSWVPLTHNLGLIVSHLLGMVCHLNSYLMKTELFLYSPYLWMEKMSELRATLTCSPNFGYLLYLNSIKNQKLKKMDLSCVRLICNGAEPIAEPLCKKFLQVLAPYGLKDTVYQTAYGLSEATVSVTSSTPGEQLKSVIINGKNQIIGRHVEYVDEANQNGYTLKLITVGAPHHNVKIRIAADEISLGEDKFGEIQIKSPIVSNGYYDNDELSKRLYTSDGWLKTGDIGFLHECFLYICGRDKDIIFINGKNYYSHDIERLLYSVDPSKEYGVIGEFNANINRDMIVAFVKEEMEDKDFNAFVLRLKEEVMRSSGISIDKVIRVTEIPKTTSGKIQYFKLKELYRVIQEKNLLIKQENIATNSQEPNNSVTSILTSKRNIILKIQKIIEGIVGFPVEDIHRSLLEYGISSVKVAQFNQQLTELTTREIPSSLVYEYPTIDKIAGFCLGEEEEKYEGYTDPQKDKIAIIGMGCKFPGNINNPEELWEMLLAGRQVVTEVPENRPIIYKYAKEKNIKLYGGYLEDIAHFDARKYHMTPIEAKVLDPQQRLLLEVTDQALQNAGIDPHRTEGKPIGVFVGSGSGDYMELINEEIGIEEINNYMLSGNMGSIAAGRIGYFYDWHGPIMTVDTACSSTLVAMHQAISSIEKNECSMAIVAGANVILSPRGYKGLLKMNALSPTGSCKTFDETADGYVRSEGAAAVILKRYSDAIRDNDSIMCVVKGSAINYDGRSNGLTAPNGIAQTNVVMDALKNANMKPEEIDYIEAHGTGTRLGDPVEVNALSRVFSKEKKIYLGSIKSNIGHTESVAGLASVIKSVLMLKHGIIPPKINYSIPNSLIPWRNTPFVINKENVAWNEKKSVKSIGISSFGLSGTNVHVILQQEKSLIEMQDSDKNECEKLFVVSADDKELLKKDLEKYRIFIRDTEENLSEICSAVLKVRAGGKVKFYTVVKNKKELIKQLENFEGYEVEPWYVAWKTNPIVLRLKGMYDHSLSMITNLCNDNQIWKKYILECNVICKKRFALDIFTKNIDLNNRNKKMSALFSLILEYTIIRTFYDMGVRPKYIVGSGVSKIALGIIANKCTLEDGLVDVYHNNIEIQENKYTYLCKSENEEMVLQEEKGIYSQQESGDGYFEILIGDFSCEITKQKILQITNERGWLEALGKLCVAGYEIDFSESVSRWKGIQLPERSQNKKYFWYE